VFEPDLRYIKACRKLQYYMGHVCPIVEDVAVKDLVGKREDLILQ
jgi:hypothetical protein